MQHGSALLPSWLVDICGREYDGMWHYILHLAMACWNATARASPWMQLCQPDAPSAGFMSTCDDIHLKVTTLTGPFITSSFIITCIPCLLMTEQCKLDRGLV